MRESLTAIPPVRTPARNVNIPWVILRIRSLDYPDENYRVTSKMEWISPGKYSHLKRPRIT